jgi:transcriptional regulator with XRE-family HTH domain
MSNIMICVQFEDTVSLRWDKELGLKLKGLRQAKTITRKELALFTAISYPLLEKIETGLVETITKDKLLLIINTLKINLSELYSVIEIKL